MSAPLEQLIGQLETTGNLAHRLVEEDVWDMERRDVDRILRATELLTVSIARGLEQARTSQAAGEVTAVRKVDAQFVADALVRASHEANRARSRRPL